MCKHKEVSTMLRKLISAIMAIACLFMLVAGAFGIRDIMKEKSDGEKEKAATLEKLDTLKAGKEKLEENRAAYEEGKTTYAEGTAAYEQGKADYAKGQQDLQNGLKEYNDGKATLAKGKADYAAGEKKLAYGQKQYDTGMQQYNEKLAEYNYSVKNKDAIVTAATEQYMKENQKAVKALVAQNVEAQVTAAAKKQMLTPDIQKQMEDAVNQQLLAYKQANPDASEAELAAVTEKAQAAVEAATLEKVTAAIKADETTMAYITSEVTKAVETGIRAEVEKEVDTRLADAKKQLQSAKAKLADAKKQLDAGKAELAKNAPTIAAGEKKLAAAANELDAGKTKLVNAEKQLADAQKQLADGKAKLDEFEAGQAQIDAGYETLMQNEKIAAKVKNDNMDALDAGYLVVEESTAETTEDLVTRAVYMGASMVAALLGIIAAVLVFRGGGAKVLAIVIFAVALAALIYGITRRFAAHPLQMAAMITLCSAALVFIPAAIRKTEKV